MTNRGMAEHRNSGLEPRLRVFLDGIAFEIVPQQHEVPQGGPMKCSNYHDQCMWVVPGGEILDYESMMYRLLGAGAKVQYIGGRAAA